VIVAVLDTKPIPKDPEKMVLLAKQLEAVIGEREQKLRKSPDRGGIDLEGD
jgi:hypothetical protein